MKSSSCAIALMIVGIMFVGDNLAAAATQKASGPSQVLRFRNADGWGAPSVRVSDDKLSVTLGFRSTPERINDALDKLLTERARRVISHAQLRTKGKRTFVDLQLSRPLQKFKRKRYLKKNWLVRLELKSSEAIPRPSYASVFPDGLERIVAEETERSMAEGDPDCGGMNVLRKEDAAWSLFATMMYAQCLQNDRKYKDARKMMKRVIREAAPESPLGILAALRLNSWKRQKRFRVGSGSINWNTLPGPLAQELGLRLAQKTFSRDLSKATDYFLEAMKAGTLDQTLMNRAQSLRFDLIQRVVDSGNFDMAKKLGDSLELPSKDHPAFRGVSRAIAITLARSGEPVKATSVASHTTPDEHATLVDAAMFKVLDDAGTAGAVQMQPLETTNRALDMNAENKADAPSASAPVDQKNDRILTPPINKMAIDNEVPWEKLDEILGFSRHFNENGIKENKIISTEYIKSPSSPTMNELELALALQKPISMKPSMNDALTAGIQTSMNKGGK